MKKHRKLAAIMFTDIEGFSAMMQHDEDEALVVKSRHREVLRSGHEQYKGRIIQYYGDGTLSTFQSAVEAVQCALHMQCAFMKDLQIPVRIGLHLGDIIYSKENIYGDGVNLASRIESLGVPGCVLISDKVAAEIHNHPKLEAVSLGAYQFKNIGRQVEVFAMNYPGLVVPCPQSLTGKTSAKPQLPAGSERLLAYDDTSNREAIYSIDSIAVLPFADMSDDLEKEHFGDCLTEEVLTAITRIRGLKVAAHTSSFRFKGSKKDLRKIGKKLGVSTVLEGCAWRHNGHIRFTAQLVNAADGFQIWSEKFDTDTADLLEVQDQIAGLLIRKLESCIPTQPLPTIPYLASGLKPIAYGHPTLYNQPGQNLWQRA